MWTPKDRTTAIAAWAGIVATVAACSVVLGASFTMNSGVLLLLACVVPPAVMLMMWRGAPAPTVAEMLHADDRRADV